ncbi:hypothetical protein [Halomonas kalidii]|uniref:Uncharacterized protein n=1 Tax=Halomonas kalidii TaxID=3043293 RepID=A0ABT6VJU1_9GAMM|nr:hypothetical protein [Halomonas kalidii]MDI5933021.1 hypothetical protein [Halomonas kalidii]
MILSGDSLAARASSVGFFVLFPGFMIYHTLVALGLIPAFLGGLFGMVSVLMFGIYVVVLPSQRHVMFSATRGFALLVMAFFAYVLCWSVASYGLQGGGQLRAAMIQSLETMVLWLVLFVMGYRVPLDSPALAKAFRIAFLATTGYLLLFVVTTGQLMFFARQMIEAGGGDNVSTYQGYARSGLVMLVFLIAVSRSAAGRAGLIAMGAFVMFVLGARSELYAFLALVMVLLVVWAGMSAKYLLTLLAVLVLAVLVVASQFEAMSGTRQLQVLDLSGTSSWMARQDLGQRALGQIIASPWLGNFGGHVTAAGGTGGYAHSMLSAWVNYGLLGFVLYVGMTVVAFLGAAYRMVYRRDTSAWWVFAFSINFVCLLLVVLAKPVFWPLPALGWGAFANAMVCTRRATQDDASRRDENVQQEAADDSQGRDDHESVTSDLRPSPL